MMPQAVRMRMAQMALPLGQVHSVPLQQSSRHQVCVVDWFTIIGLHLGAMGCGECVLACNRGGGHSLLTVHHPCACLLACFCE